MPYTEEGIKLAEQFKNRSASEIPESDQYRKKFVELENGIGKKYGQSLPGYIAKEAFVHGIQRGVIARGLGLNFTEFSYIMDFFAIPVSNKAGKRILDPEYKLHTQKAVEAFKDAVEKPAYLTFKEVEEIAERLVTQRVNDPEDQADAEIARIMQIHYDCARFSTRHVQKIRERLGLHKIQPPNSPQTEQALDEPNGKPDPVKEEREYLTWVLKNKSPFKTWLVLYNERLYSPIQEPTVIDVPESIVTYDELKTSIQYAMGSEENNAAETAEQVLQFVGFNGIVLENMFRNSFNKAKYSGIFGMLQDVGITRPVYTEEISFKSKKWRAQYWILNERKIREYVEKAREQAKQPKDERTREEIADEKAKENPTEFYAALDEGAWKRENGKTKEQANGQST